MRRSCGVRRRRISRPNERQPGLPNYNNKKKRQLKNLPLMVLNLGEREKTEIGKCKFVDLSVLMKRLYRSNSTESIQSARTVLVNSFVLAKYFSHYLHALWYGELDVFGTIFKFLFWFQGRRRRRFWNVSGKCSGKITQGHCSFKERFVELLITGMSEKYMYEASRKLLNAT